MKPQATIFRILAVIATILFLASIVLFWCMYLPLVTKIILSAITIILLISFRIQLREFVAVEYDSRDEK